MSTYFVKNLHIARPDGAGTMCGGSILTFESNVSGLQKSDVTNSILLAQLVADRRYDRADTSNWYGSFKDILENVGWMASGFSFDQVALGNSPSADQVVMDCMRAQLESSGVKTVQTAVDVVKGMSNDDRALQIFKGLRPNGHRQSSSVNNANFRIAYCKTSGGNVALGLGSFVYRIGRNIGNPLTSTLEGKSASASSSFQEMILNQEVYSQVRQAVISKLGSFAKDLVDEF
ncbi:hypothetical protein FRC10_000593 [Ceratobasidium sp. 414]|nr:hypothetical protein FRC10_000593 [Ceratobasidium sp. 414]